MVKREKLVNIEKIKYYEEKEIEEQKEYVVKMIKYLENNPKEINRIIANLIYNDRRIFV
jgi:hypothetical protein